MSRAAFTRYIQDVCTTRVQLLAFLMAVWFTSNGPLGLMINQDFPTHSTHSMYSMYSASFYAFGVIPVAVNGWHALFHLATGVAGLLAVRTRIGAIRYAAATALIYWGMTVVCLVGGMSVCSVMAVDTVANWVHGAEGLILASIAVYGVVGGARQPARAVPAP
ncbi:DUF4383 domain-containing protein [Mycobacterium sp. D16Q16]|uniref:DUF4383 domain-containing protein n=1 Tax=Mycobacterium sp. D16Q16 TaxID=1855659 RepID=UPI0009945A21|nr:DUF4383 domain-containing protein [Mycobacterium sp. D16Q16]